MLQKILSHLVLASLFTLLFVAFSASAYAETWTLVEVAGPTGTTRVIPRAINNNGVVVGTARFLGRTEDTAFRWEDGVMVELQLPAGAFSSTARDITDSGVIVGYVSYRQAASEDGTFATYWTWNTSTQQSTAIKLAYNFEGESTTFSYFDYGSHFLGVNEKLDMVGYGGKKNSSNLLVIRALLSAGGGAYQELPGSETLNFATKINASGTVLCKTNVGPADRSILIGGGPNTLLDLNGGFQGLNDLGQAAGESMFVPGQIQHAMWFDGTQHIDLGLGQPNSRSIADSINNNSWVVGRVGIGSNGAPDFQGAFGYLWRPGVVATGLSFLGGTSWLIHSATDINDLNQIVGVGKNGVTLGGYLMTPVGTAFELTGIVRNGAGTVQAEVPVRVVRLNGAPAGDPVKTDLLGKYKWTLSSGTYYVTALPEGSFPIGTNDGCDISGAICKINLDRNKVVDFGSEASLNDQLKQKISSASTLLKGLKLKVSKSQLAAQKQLRSELKTLSSEIATFATTYRSNLAVKSTKINLVKLSGGLKSAITRVMKAKSKNFAADKKSANSALKKLLNGVG